MEIILNGKKQDLEEVLNLEELIAQHGRAVSNTVASVNGRILQPYEVNGLKLESGDVVELMSFVGGG